MLKRESLKYLKKIINYNTINIANDKELLRYCLDKNINDINHILIDLINKYIDNPTLELEELINKEFKNFVNSNIDINSKIDILIKIIQINPIFPVNSNSSLNARKLLNYLGSIENRKIITGQHTQTVPKEELAHLKKLTGFTPLLTGYELLGYSLNINPKSDDVCLKEVKENQNTLELALKDDGVITFTWHMFSPLYGLGKSFYQEYTSFDARNIFVKNSNEEKAFYNELDHMADFLKPFLEEDKPIIFRPFHEADGKWFWWGSKGDNVGRDLYKLVYDYYVNVKHLDNLIWVWNSPNKLGYPGDNYVDIISRDFYTEKHKITSYIDEYNELINNTTNNKLVALAECGVIPDIIELEKENYPWVYFMTWSKEFILSEEYNYNSKIIEMYKSNNSIKKS